MRIAYGSDLHLEYGPLSALGMPEADALVLAGDICVAREFIGWPSSEGPVAISEATLVRAFFERVCATYPQVLYVLGNHEHYHCDIAQTLTVLREAFKDLPNLHILSNSSMAIPAPNGRLVHFYGGTMWTHITNPLLALGARRLIADYEVISDGPRRLLKTERTDQLFKDFVQGLDEFLGQYQESPKVVISHHAPSSLSIAPRFEGSPLNPFFYQDMSERILDSQNLNVWIHGHMHDPVHYQLGHTQVRANPRGYPRERPGLQYAFELVNVPS